MIAASHMQMAGPLLGTCEDPSNVMCQAKGSQPCNMFIVASSGLAYMP